MDLEDIESIRSVVREETLRHAARAQPSAVNQVLKYAGAVVALLVSLWAGASYLFVTDSKASSDHTVIRAEHNSDMTDVIDSIGGVNNTTMLINQRVEQIEKRLDKFEARIDRRGRR